MLNTYTIKEVVSRDAVVFCCIKRYTEMAEKSKAIHKKLHPSSFYIASLYLVDRVPC